MIELFIGFIYNFVFYSCLVGRGLPESHFGFSLGAVYLATTIAFGPYSGACLNIARSFGPALITGNLRRNITPMVASVLGHLFGAYYYETF